MKSQSETLLAAAFSFDVKPLSYFELFEERITKLPSSGGVQYRGTKRLFTFCLMANTSSKLLQMMRGDTKVSRFMTARINNKANWP